MAYDKAIFSKSLLSLLQTLEGKMTTIELRNETSVTGKLVSVDSSMNLQVENAVLSYDTDRVYSNLYIQGKQIRYVQIPSELNVAETLREQVCKAKNLREFNDRPLKQKPRKKRQIPAKTMGDNQNQ